MKNNLSLIIFFFLFGVFQAQENQNADITKMSKEQRQEYMKTLTPEQRKTVLGEAMTSLVIRKLDIPVEKQEAFKKVYKDYKSSQRLIREKFKPNDNVAVMTEEEAKAKLYQNFELSQTLLDHRKTYTEKFLKVISAKQVLQLFEQERKMRQQYQNRKQKMSPPEGRGPEVQQ